jgi:hypothetical protein
MRIFNHSTGKQIIHIGLRLNSVTFQEFLPGLFFFDKQAGH